MTDKYEPDYMDEHVEKMLPLIYEELKKRNMGERPADTDLLNEIMRGGFSRREADEMLSRGRQRGVIPK